MSTIRLARTVGTAVVLVGIPLATAVAQAQPSPPTPQSPPAATTPQTMPSAPQTTPSTPPAEKKAAAPAALESNLVGLSAKSSDGTNLGAVHTVMAQPNGKSTIGVKVGGFLGFGGHMVAIPDGKFSRVGDTVQVNMTADEVHKLPQAVEQK